jgi:negative regulator of sigma E activity
MTPTRLKNTRSAIGRHLARVEADVRQAERLHGQQREAVLRGAARHFMQAGFHHLAADVRRRARGVSK